MTRHKKKPYMQTKDEILQIKDAIIYLARLLRAHREPASGLKVGKRLSPNQCKLHKHGDNMTKKCDFETNTGYS